MAAKTTVFIATSLDGFIARPDGSLDWLDKASATVPKGEDCGYQEFMKSVDVLVMGRKSYKKVRTLGPWPYGETPVTVLSRNAILFPDEIPKCVTHSSESPEALHARLTGEGAKQIYIDGGVTIQRFLCASLVDELIITVIPVLLGAGISLFGTLEQDVPLRHLSTTAYPFGFVQSRYAIC